MVADLGPRTPVRTKPSHAGLGVETRAVMISTTSPFSVRAQRTCSLLIFAAVVRSPTLLWNGVGEIPPWHHAARP